MKAKSKRLRVFAGPNGSGKSTLIKALTLFKARYNPFSFGFYINADDIAASLRNGNFQNVQSNFEIKHEFLIEFGEGSGLLHSTFPLEAFMKSFVIEDGIIKPTDSAIVDYLAQIIARFLREKLMNSGEDFSFETVFSHPSNIDIMKEAKESGYKVYLYFVGTESPEINKQRVLARVLKGGHSVPEDRIVSRYYRSLELLYDASEVCHRVYFFDNSSNGADISLIANFEMVNGKKLWGKVIPDKLPIWFKEFYLSKAVEK